MKTRDEIISFIARNKNLFRKEFHITKIGIFGSYAREEQNKVSDLDLIVEFEDNTQNLYDLKFDLKEFFRSKLGIEVHICREKFIKPRIKEEILKETLYVTQAFVPEPTATKNFVFLQKKPI